MSHPLQVFDFRHENASLNSGIQLSRESEASYFGPDGLLHFAQPGQNWLTYSQTIGHSLWNKVGTAVSVPTDVLCTDGTATANRISEKDASGEHRISRALTVVQGVPLTISIYAKAGTRSKVQFSFQNASSYKGGNPAVKVNLLDGSFISVSTNVLSYNAVNSGHGWWRISLTGVPDLGTISGIHLYMLNDNNSISYKGNTDKFLYAWGAQVEQGEGLRSYVPTTMAPYFGLRFNYNVDSTHAPIGALIEPAATNLVPFSHIIDNDAWRKQYAKVLLSGTLSPDGSTMGYKLREDLNNSSHYIMPHPMISAARGSTYTFSGFLKAAERKWAYFNINNATVHFDLVNGVIGNQSYKYSAASIERAGNGWFRCSATFIADSPASSTKIGAEQVNGETSYRGDGNSGILVWGFQLESGDKRTSYIRTKGAAAMRSADVVTLSKPTNSNQHDIFVQRTDGGTWLNNMEGSHQLTCSDKEVQIVNFYNPEEPSSMKDQTAQTMFPYDYRAIGASGSRIMILGVEYNTQTPNKPWSMQKAVNKLAPIFRAQVNGGETWSGDASGPKKKERSELYMKHGSLPFNQDVWLSYAIRIEPGESLNLTPMEACFLGQFHASEDPKDINAGPVLGLRLEGQDTIRAYTCATVDNPHFVSPKAVLRGGSQFTRGIWHKVVFRLRFSPTNGQLQWWHNGREIINLSNIGMGYPDAKGPYWKFGVYRTTMPQTLAVEYANMELSITTSLYSRVAEPLVIA